MKKSIIALGIAGILTIGVGVAAFATENTNSETGNKFRQNGSTCVQQLMDNGKSFEEAKKEALDSKYARVDAAVERGVITKERGEEIKAEMKANADSCTTPGEKKNTHSGYGLNKGLNGKGNSMKNGNGNGMGQGSCVAK